MGGFFFCSVHVFQTSPNARASFAKQNSASAMMLTSRLRVEVWRCSNNNHADTLVPHGNWCKRSTQPELRRFFCGESSFRLTWFMIMIYTRFSADSRSRRKIWLSHHHFLPHARSQFELHDVWGTWQHQNWYLPTPIMAKRVSRSQNSSFTCFLKYLEHQKWYLATSNMAKRVVIEKSHHAWACVIGISQPFQLTLWFSTALATVTWHVRRGLTVECTPPDEECSLPYLNRVFLHLKLCRFLSTFAWALPLSLYSLKSMICFLKRDND